MTKTVAQKIRFTAHAIACLAALFGQRRASATSGTTTPPASARREESATTSEWVFEEIKAPVHAMAIPEPDGQAGDLDANYQRVEQPRWPYWPWVWVLVVLMAIAGWIVMLLANPYRAWQAVLFNFVYFTPLAAGMLTWSAIVMACRGTWMGESKSISLNAVVVAPVTILAFLALWVGYRYWGGWLRFQDLKNSAWVNSPFMFMRDGVALAFFWSLAYWFSKRARDGAPHKLGAWLILVYCIVFSLLGFDLVMALDPHWVSSLFAGYFFISGLYTALAGWTLLSILNQRSCRAAPVKDFAQLLVAFCLLTTYMMYAQLLPIWYENMPEEVRFVIPRLQITSWPWLSLALLTVVYLGPLVFLLPRKAKTNAAYVACAAFSILLGMWFERWWLVGPTLGQTFALHGADVCAGAAFVAAFGLCLSIRNRGNPIVVVRRSNGA